MPNRDTPMGFRPAQGVGAKHFIVRFPVDSGNGTAVFVGDVMDLNAQGSVRPAAADAGVSAAGVCVGLYDSNGIPVGHPSSSVATKYLGASTAGYADVALALPGAIFIAQAQTGQTPASEDIAETTDHVAGAGDTTTARSRHELNFSDLGTGLQFRIIGLVADPDNSWAEHADVYVMFNESAFGVSAAASV
ncbi:MAG TPA: hypothetical protein V6D12_14155 [Candidatus Obscuribacterales bacterium]